MSKLLSPHIVALHTTQLAIAELIHWAGGQLPNRCSLEPDQAGSATTRAKLLFKWKTAKIGTLRLLFDRVKLSEDQTSRTNYLPISKIDDSNPAIPYPITQSPDNFADCRQQILNLPIEQNWNNLSFLSLILEKYGACLSFGQDECDVALPDVVRITGAVAAAIATDPTAKQLSLIAASLSGIQDFIYTISSDGALKSLRARSFYLELVTEEVVQQLLERLDLPRTSIIYTGGGKLYLLAPTGVEEKVNNLRREFNEWLRDKFQGKIFLSVTTETCEVEHTATSAFIQTWEKAIAALNDQKTLKFADQLDKVLEPQASHAPCKVCHRDDEETLQPLNGESSVLACSTCREMFQLGGRLLNAQKFIRSRKNGLSTNPICVALSSGAVYYHLFDEKKPVDFKEDTLLLINNWNLKEYERPNTMPLLLGNYGQDTEEENESGFMSAGEFAENSQGIKRVGYLRMDVDRLGQIFARGIKDSYSLPKLAGLSRQMSYFFKVYLNSLASDRTTNFLDKADKYPFKAFTQDPRKRLLVIYAGGDDLFVSGSWNEIVEFAFDVYQAFRAYTGYNPDITLSGGISLAIDKFPLYQAANEAGEAEDQAKDNGRDSLGLFGSAFKWGVWLGDKGQISELDSTAKQHLTGNSEPELFGVWDFVQLFHQKLSGNYAQSFVRNLLATAQLQEQHIQEKEDLIRDRKKQNADTAQLEYDREEIRYYLHLPKIAYTLARLPSELRDNKEEFKPIRSSLLSPYNAPYFRAIATWIELLNRDKS